MGDYKELRPEEKLKVSDMEELYFHERIELLNDVQKAHIVDAGWVIQTYSDPKQIDNDRWWRVGMPAATKRAAAALAVLSQQSERDSSMSHRNFRQIRAIKNHARSLHLNLELAAWQWCVNGLAQRWAEGEI